MEKKEKPTHKTADKVYVICSHCKKILNEEGFWDYQSLTRYDETKHLFSHGICPLCMLELYPNTYMSIQEKQGENT